MSRPNIPITHPLSVFVEPIRWIYPDGTKTCSACAAKIESSWPAEQQHLEFHAGLAFLAETAWIRGLPL